MPHALQTRRESTRAGSRSARLHGRGDISLRSRQYLSGDYRALCERLGVTQSAGRVGTAADNAAAESFWSTLKRELVHRYRFSSRDEAKRAITFWINRYNAVRLHSSIGNVPLIEWEIEYRRQELLAA